MNRVNLLVFILIFWYALIIGNSSYVFGDDIEFTSVRSGKADVADKENDFGIIVKFNNLTTSYSSGAPDTKAKLTMFGASYRHDGRDVSFNAFSSAGTTSETKENNAIVNGGSSYVIDGGVDLNYIIINENRLFLSAGLAGIGYIGGIFIDRIDLKRGNLGVINTLGVDTRASFYPLDEIYFTGYMSAGFISLYSRSLTGSSTSSSGTAPDFTYTINEVEKLFQFLINGKVFYRPLSTFSVSAGLGFASTSFTDSATKEKYTYYNFYPTVGIDFLF